MLFKLISKIIEYQEILLLGWLSSNYICPILIDFDGREFKKIDLWNSE